MGFFKVLGVVFIMDDSCLWCFRYDGGRLPLQADTEHHSRINTGCHYATAHLGVARCRAMFSFLVVQMASLSTTPWPIMQGKGRNSTALHKKIATLKCGSLQHEKERNCGFFLPKHSAAFSGSNSAAPDCSRSGPHTWTCCEALVQAERGPTSRCSPPPAQPPGNSSSNSSSNNNSTGTQPT